jgi:choline kinase/8-oxo-dGTP pyrophosphatase MutT (NUDIX family)
MKIVFLGAGSGTRLRPYTESRPKWMLPLRGVPILEYLVACAHEAGATEVVVVRGTAGGKVRSPSVLYVDDHDGFNMVHSLFKAEAYLSGDVIVSYADILYEPDVLRRLLSTDAPISVVVDLEWHSYYAARTADALAIAESLVLDDDRIIEIGQPLQPGDLPCGQYVGLIKFNANGAKALCQTYRDLLRTYHGQPWRNATRFENAYMTDMLQELIDRGIDVRAAPIHSGWLEFDTTLDYERALEWDAEGVLSRFLRLDRLPRNPSVLSAGGVVARLVNERCEILLVGDDTPHGWRLPKGMQEAGESIEETAVREVAEETGLEAAIVRYVGRAGWTYEYQGDWWDERVHFYLMRPLRESASRQDGEFSRIQWMPAEQAVGALRYESEREILAAATELVDPVSFTDVGEDHGYR